jgi:membrane associated rhomboid family serine protease
MLSDRSYMRETDPARELRPLAWLIGGLVAAFAVQFFVDRPFHGLVERWFALSPGALFQGRVWGLLTYSLLHDTTNPLHLISNSLAILFIGRSLLPAVGRQRFFLTYAAGVLAAGIFWLAVHFPHDSSTLVGASGAAYALLALFCCQFAHDRMTLLLFFVVPITVVPRYLLMVLAGIEGVFFLFAELFPSGASSPFAHSAHLAGMAAGVIAFRYFRAADEPERPAKPAVELPRWMSKKTAAAPRKGATKVNVATRSDLKAEVDRILDKINTSGFGSLSPDEKRTLDEARDLMTKR